MFFSFKMCDYKSRQSLIQQNGLTFLYWIGFLEVEVEKANFSRFFKDRKKKETNEQTKKKKKKEISESISKSTKSFVIPDLPFLSILVGRILHFWFSLEDNETLLIVSFKLFVWSLWWTLRKKQVQTMVT